MSEAQNPNNTGHAAAKPVDRRRFMQTAGAITLASGLAPSLAFAKTKPGVPESVSKAASTKVTAESAAKDFYQSLSEKQKKAVCFAWDHQQPKKGLLRTRVENNWQITPHDVASDFYTDDQRSMIRSVLNQLIQPEWHARYEKKMDDDSGGFGHDQAIAIFGAPEEDKFEFVMTGRHMTLRCDGNSAGHVAFGGPIFYGHAAEDFHEDAEHENNVFWSQAVAANNLYKMFDGKQRKLALAPKTPKAEKSVAFQGPNGKFHGIPVPEMSSDQKENLQTVLAKLVEPFRQSDQDEVIQCLKTQGGLDACSLAFFKDKDIGDDEVWDNWRLEGPSFVWYFRSAPHVHVWVNVADSPKVKLNA